jgi:beta-galactosidase
MKRLLSHILIVTGIFSFPAKGIAGETPLQVKRIISFTTMSSLKLEASFEELPAEGAKYHLLIKDERTGKAVFDNEASPSQVIKEENKLVFEATQLTVDRWTPSNPRLYRLVFTVTAPNGLVDEKEQHIGFRFFESREGHLFLNGKPIFLRGIAINPPSRGIPDSIEKSRKFAEDYVRYMKSINVNIIRIPNDETWYSVCDEMGMMVFGGNYSGTVMGEKPPKDYDKAVAWYRNEAFAGIASHPSLMIYAMTNEVSYEGAAGEQWEKFLSYAYIQLRKWDDTRSYIANPGYGYGKSGDICDLHRYWGWYYCSPFTFLNIRHNESIIPFKKKMQPVTFTECVGNYTGPDGKYNLTPDHKNPGSQLNWTGHADWSDQARLADEHQSFTFKQATELFRRLRVINPELSGVFPFTILFYNWNNVQQFVDMEPKPVTKQVRLSYQPILLSWENWTTQVYAGATIHPGVHIVNDDNDQRDLVGARLIYQLRDKGDMVIQADTIALPQIDYYNTWHTKLSISLPAHLVTGHYQLKGIILRDGKMISENYDDLFIAHRDMSAASAAKRPVLLYDPAGLTAASFGKLSVKYKKVNDLVLLSKTSLLVIGENAIDNGLVKQAAVLKQFIKNGGRILCLRQDESHLQALNNILPVALKNVTTGLDVPSYPPPPRPSRNGYYVNPERPGHPIFNNIKREQLRIWSDYSNWDESKPGFPAIYPVTDGFVPENKKDIEHLAVLGNYGVALEGITIAEIFDGKGSILVCGLDLAHRTQLDPVADQMMINLVDYMGDESLHERYPLITSPITWGDYASEKGILTGVNSGLMVNAVPRVPANNRSKITVTKEGNRFLGATGGFNTRPGVQYVAYGRRMYGPYTLRGFGNVPEPIDTSTNTGEGFFWCTVPAGRKISSTLVWNQDDQPQTISIRVNEQPMITKEIRAGETVEVDCPVNSSIIKMSFSGDRRLVLLQTAFK